MNVVLVMMSCCCRLKKQKKKEIERKKKNYTSVRESRLKAKETNKQAAVTAEKNKKTGIVRIEASILDKKRKKQNRHRRSVIIKVRKKENGQ